MKHTAKILYRKFETYIPREGTTRPHTVKKRLTILPSLAGISLTKVSLAGNTFIIPGQGEFWLVTSWLETGKSLTFIYSAVPIPTFMFLCAISIFP
jgi:hypothetical protein